METYNKKTHTLSIIGIFLCTTLFILTSYNFYQEIKNNTVHSGIFFTHVMLIGLYSTGSLNSVLGMIWERTKKDSTRKPEQFEKMSKFMNNIGEYNGEIYTINKIVSIFSLIALILTSSIFYQGIKNNAINLSGFFMNIMLIGMFFSGTIFFFVNVLLELAKETNTGTSKQFEKI